MNSPFFEVHVGFGLRVIKVSKDPAACRTCNHAGWFKPNVYPLHAEIALHRHRQLHLPGDVILLEFRGLAKIGNTVLWIEHCPVGASGYTCLSATTFLLVDVNDSIPALLNRMTRARLQAWRIFAMIAQNGQEESPGLREGTILSAENTCEHNIGRGSLLLLARNCARIAPNASSQVDYHAQPCHLVSSSSCRYLQQVNDHDLRQIRNWITQLVSSHQFAIYRESKPVPVRPTLIHHLLVQRASGSCRYRLQEVFGGVSFELRFGRTERQTRVCSSYTVDCHLAGLHLVYRLHLHPCRCLVAGRDRIHLL